jgi:hypothetical protein
MIHLSKQKQVSRETIGKYMNKSNSKSYLERAKKLYELKELERLGLTPTLDQRDIILRYMALLLKWNAAAGLISPNDEEYVFFKTFL